MLDYVRARDTVVVVALDRLGRSLSGVIRTVEMLTERGVLLRSLRRAGRGFRGHTRRAYWNDIRAWYAWCASAGVHPLAAQRGRRPG